MKKLEIGNKILNRINDEAHQGKTQIAKAYVEMIREDGQKSIVWLIPGELGPGHSLKRDFRGNAFGTNEEKIPYVKIGGEAVYSKNSPFGNALAELVDGTGVIKIPAPKKTDIATIEARAEYQVDLRKEDAFQGLLYIQGEDKFPFEDSLRERLKLLDDLLAKQQEAAASETEMQELKDEINSLKAQISEKAQNAKRYRRTTQSIRQNFMLDPTQNKIKRHKLFNGPLVINGGPGTGKTTLLIHKIQYMLDPDVEQDINLIAKVSKEQWAVIRNQKTGWLFFSPTDLLKKYLEDAMTSEGLSANNDTVKTWQQFRNTLKTSLGLFNPDKSRPFLAFNDNTLLLKLSAEEAKRLLEDFTATLLMQIIKKIEKLQKLKITSLDWGKKGLEIRSSLGAIQSNTSLDRIILIFKSLHESHKELRLEIDKKYKEQVDAIASVIQRKLTEEDLKLFRELLAEARVKRNGKATDQDIDEEENEELEEAFEDEETLEGKLKLDINRTIKRVVRNLALATLDSSANKSKDKDVLIIIRNYIDSANINELAPLSLFERYFKPMLKGADNVILSLIPRTYKTLRRTSFKDYEWMKAEIKERINAIIDAEPKNTRLHDDELDLVIWFVLKFAREFYINSPDLFRTSNHPYLITYGQEMKGVVAVDEATDFSITQLACMYNLSLPNLNTFILAGDMMQQMNLSGIDNWREIETLLPEVEVNDLSVSYRQTKRLLDIAIALHKSRFGNVPQFRASEPENALDPAPLVYTSTSFENKITWIANRIVELYQIYDYVIPNIALFVKDNAAIQAYADALNNHTTLNDYGIIVKACIGEGEIMSSEYVRVFNINLIKGMEFETVFFIDVDGYEDTSMKILDKLIYVGVSRATYYLAITLQHNFPNILKPIKEQFVEGDWSKQIESDY